MLWRIKATSCFVAAGTLLTLFVGPVHAGLTSVNDSIFGADSLTFDSKTNLAWLDLSFTVAKSYNDISRQLEVGGLFHGFRFASPEDVHSLFQAAGIPDINQPGGSGYNGTENNAAPSLALIQLMGPSFYRELGGVRLSEIAGFTSQHALINRFEVIQLAFAAVREDLVIEPHSQSFGAVFTIGTWALPTDMLEGVGSWLVRPIPEPPGITLVFAGLLSISLFIRVKPFTSKQRCPVALK